MQERPQEGHIKEKIMKLPDFNKESSHVTLGVNTMSLAGLSILWGIMLKLISPWFIPVAFVTLLAGFGNEIRKRDA